MKNQLGSNNNNNNRPDCELAARVPAHPHLQLLPSEDKVPSSVQPGRDRPDLPQGHPDPVRLNKRSVSGLPRGTLSEELRIHGRRLRFVRGKVDRSEPVVST
jgi:hypothetical protein